MAQLSPPRTAGHVLGIVLGAAHVSFLGVPTDGEESGPPLPVLLIGAAIGLAVIALLVWSWRLDARGPRRIAAVLLVLAALGVLPGLLVPDVGAALQFAAGAFVLLTVASIVLLFFPQRVAATVPAR